MPLAAGRFAYLHVARGSVRVGGVAMQAGDGLQLAGTDAVTIAGGQDAEVLVFDLRPETRH